VVWFRAFACVAAADCRGRLSPSLRKAGDFRSRSRAQEKLFLLVASSDQEPDQRERDSLRQIAPKHRSKKKQDKER
jgi:hypothetical protein